MENSNDPTLYRCPAIAHPDVVNIAWFYGLASEDKDEYLASNNNTCTANVAWAHLLATLYLQTGLASEWASFFLTCPILTKENIRRRNTIQPLLLRQRNWQQMYSDRKVFALEQPNIQNENEFFDLVRSLITPTQQ